jgi:Tfp pilus assembly protein PilO
MKGYLDKLNLRPSEKRLIVGIAAVLFLVLNWWFVFPHFSDWAKVQARVNKARGTLEKFQIEVQQTNRVWRSVKELESEGFSVPAEEQMLHFANTREVVAGQSGVVIGQISKVTTRTNQFFLELSQTISLLTKEQQLVDFLYNLGSSNSLIRVRDLTLRTDAPRQNLNATVKLVASYQKTSPSRQPVPGGQSKPAASTPAASTHKKP